MHEELDQIDLALSDALKAIKDEQDVLDGRVKSMDDMKESVAESVYLRVRSDYMARRDTLEAKARPLREQAREHYARLGAILDRLEADHESIKLDKQEVELRHQLGEFDATEHKRRVKEIEASAKEKGEWLAKAQDYKNRFLTAVHSEDELRSVAPARRPAPAAVAAPAPAPAPPPMAAAQTAPQAQSNYITGEVPAVQTPPPMEPVRQAAPPPAPGPVVQESGTLVMPAFKMPPAPAAPTPPPAAAGGDSSTVVFRPARLVPQNPEAGKATHSIALKPMNIGSDSINDIRIGGPGVEPRHAQIAATVQGYVVVDYDTKNGTRVNAERVRERLLANEDVIQIGAARFIFRLG